MGLGLKPANCHQDNRFLVIFLYHHTIQKEIVHLASTLTIQIVKEFWCRAQIPVKHQQDSIKKLEQLFREWRGLKKNKTPTQKHNETTFLAKVAELFDIAHPDAMELLDNPEDMLFLESQWKKGRPGCMVGIDRLLFEEDQKQKVKEKKLAQRLHRSQIEKDKLTEKSVLESSCSSLG